MAKTQKMKTPDPDKSRNDATNRNVRAAKKDLAALTERFVVLEQRVAHLEQVKDGLA